MSPRGEDMTGFLDGPCKHLILFFGSGGRVVICSKCSHMWQSTKPEAIEIDLNEDDKRVDPRAEAEPFPPPYPTVPLEDDLAGLAWAIPHHGGCMGNPITLANSFGLERRCENDRCSYPNPATPAPMDEDDVPF